MDLRHGHGPGGEEVLANLGNVNLWEQRARMRDIMIKLGFMTKEAPRALSDDNLRDIEEMRSLALGWFRNEKQARLGSQPRMRFVVPARKAEVVPAWIFDEMSRRNQGARMIYPYISVLVRPVGLGRLGEALKTGSDRAGRNDLSDLGEFERQAMYEHAIPGPQRVLHANEIFPGSNPVYMPHGTAMLIYAPDCLRRLETETRNPHDFRDDFYSFVDPAVMGAALIGFAYRDDD
jgi:hypothetical protein